MPVYYRPNYVKPSADLPLTHARVLHSGNWVRARTATAQTGTFLREGSSGDEWNNSETYDRWGVQRNLLVDSDNLSAGTWTKTRVTVSGKTVTETDATGVHGLSQVYGSFVADEYVLAVRITPGNRERLFLGMSGVASDAFITVDWRNPTLAIGESDTDRARVIDQGDGSYWVVMVFLAAAGSGEVLIRGRNATTVSYTGETSASVVIHEAVLCRQAAFATLRPFAPATIDCCCIAAHNVGSRGGRISARFNDDGSESTSGIMTVEPTNDEPIMMIFEPRVASTMRLSVFDVPMADIGVVRWGKLLQMEQPIFGGVAPDPLNRQITYEPQMSATGELIGQLVRRQATQASFTWQHMTQAFVRGPYNDFMRATDRDPAFVAWRPTGAYADDCLYGMRTGMNAPSNMGLTTLMQAGMDFQGYLSDGA